MIEINIKSGMPTAENAIASMERHISVYKSKGETALKIIHGYGSTGSGGVIRLKCRAFLRSLKDKGIIKDYCIGEEFDMFNVCGRQIYLSFPDVNKDRDWGKCNQGITVILLK